MKRIPLTMGQFALVDDADYEWLNQWKWFAVEKENSFYAARSVYLGGGRANRKYKKISMHRFIMNAPKNMEVDHRDGNGLNNQRGNLRLATSSQNKQNTRIANDNIIGFKGVSWTKDHKKLRVRIRVNGKEIILGYFTDPVLAARAYDKAAKKYFGEFAWLNNA